MLICEEFYLRINEDIVITIITCKRNTGKYIISFKAFDRVFQSCGGQWENWKLKNVLSKLWNSCTVMENENFESVTATAT